MLYKSSGTSDMLVKQKHKNKALENWNFCAYFSFNKYEISVYIQPCKKFHIEFIIFNKMSA